MSSNAPCKISDTNCVLLNPSVTEAILTVWGPDRHHVDAERRLAIKGGVISEGDLAVIRIAPIDAVISLGRRPGEGKDPASGRRRQGLDS